MHVVFRFDGGSDIGMGHASRCMALAGALSARGATTSFLCRQSTFTRLTPGNYQTVAIPEALPLSQDATHCAATLKGQNADWLVVDHYLLDSGWEKTQKPHVNKLMAIDDLGRAHACDLLLDQNFFNNPSERYVTKLEASCRTLFGPGYALLRPAIAAARPARGPLNTTSPCRVFVCFGGADIHNTTLLALHALAGIRTFDIAADIVIGPAHAHQSAIQEYCARFPNWRLWVGHAAPERLMAKADIGIGAGGVMTWERCVVGLPSVVVTIADNQRDIAIALAASEMIAYPGHYDQVTATALQAAIESLWNDAHARKRMGADGMSLVDGNGAARVTDIMCG
jgi:UDP-2,4-diacetamido-2,4,6-trideoxy-beta-L-altropyranose hydrolase